MIAAHQLDALALGDPPAARQQGRLIAFKDLRSAGFADVPGVDDDLGFSGARRGRLGHLGAVLEIAEFEVMEVAAVRARDVIAAAVAALIRLVDAALVGIGRRRDEKGLRAREGALPVLDQRHRVALATDVPLVGVHLVADHVGQVVGAQRVGAVCSRLDDPGVGAVLEDVGPVGAAARGPADQIGERRILADHLGQARIE